MYSTRLIRWMSNLIVILLLLLYQANVRIDILFLRYYAKKQTKLKTDNVEGYI